MTTMKSSLFVFYRFRKGLFSSLSRFEEEEFHLCMPVGFRGDIIGNTAFAGLGQPV